MNIFFVDYDPTKAAQALVDKHVVKMILESAQLLSTAHRVMDGKEKTIITPDQIVIAYDEFDRPCKQLIKGGRKQKIYQLEDDRDSHIYKATHINHPSAIWIRESVENYNWLSGHYFALMDEYAFRYGKQHKCRELAFFIQTPPNNLQKWERTPVKLAMPDEYKVADPVESYRNYYRGAKRDLFKWTKRERPDWL